MNNLALYYSKKLTAGVALSMMLCCLFCVLSLAFNIGVFANPILPHLVFLLWIITICLVSPESVYRIVSRKYYALLYIFLIYYFLASLAAFSFQTSLNRVFTTLELFSPLMMYELYSEYDNRVKRWIIITLTAIIMINCYQMYQTLDLSVLGLKQHIDEDGFLSGAFHRIYSFAIMSGVFIHLIRSEHANKIQKIILSAALLICVYFVLRSLFATAMFLMFFSVLLGFVYGRKRWFARYVVWAVLIVAFSFSFLPIILSYVAKINPDSTALVVRVEEVFNLMQGISDSDNSSAARFQRTLNSLTTFLNYPIFGVTHLTANWESVEGNMVGNHAEWVDTMALYGLFSFVLFTFMWKNAKYVFRNTDMGIIFITYIILGFVNPCLFLNQTIILFFYMPMVIDYIKNK